jgi:hypothetical protein
MTNDVTPRPAGDVLESVIIKGDLGTLTAAERVVYYERVCRSLGLNPYTSPFAYMLLQGKLQLYAKRDAADQLRKLHGISIEIVEQRQSGDLYVVRVQAKDPSGRTDEDLGVVPLPDTIKGEARSNQIMKAITKAKRRVTLSICGLAFMDETEVASLAEARTAPGPSPQELSLAMQDEIPFGADDVARSSPGAAAPAAASSSQAQQEGSAPPQNAAATISLEDMAREAAQLGPDVLKQFFNSRNSADKKKLRAIEAELVSLYPQNRKT